MKREINVDGVSERADIPQLTRRCGLGVLAAASAFSICIVLAATALAGSLDFYEPDSSPEDGRRAPTSLAAADLDGDGDQDLAVASAGSEAVTVLKNNGAGNFNKTAAVPAPVEGGAKLVVADLDSDTDQDLAVAHRDAGLMTILLNDGAAHFHQPASSPVPAGPSPWGRFAAADLDGDTDQDLAVANNWNPGTVTILENDGTGDFHQAASSPEPVGEVRPTAVAAADLDGDGDQDLAVPLRYAATVAILENDGTGDFAEAPTSPEPVGKEPWEVAAADLDGDGDQDLAVVNKGSSLRCRNYGNVTILLNDGAGNFSTSHNEPVAVHPLSLAPADFDGDRDQDLAVAHGCPFAPAFVTILKNKDTGTGDFGQAPTGPEAAGGSVSDLAAADFNGDGEPDLAIANGGSDTVTILKNR